MKTKGINYSGPDGFRIIAALMIIMIHTSVLTSFTETGDFLLTRVVARTAVPFFFMVTGYFVLPKMKADSRAVIPSLVKLSCLYGISILLYLPLNLYSGQFQGIGPGGLLKKIFFDGTFYHLWYFPAVILGLLLILVFMRFLSLKGCMILSLILYAVGLGGDSYYGLLSAASPVRIFYDGIFRFSSYTRNGLFLAPVFLCLGWLLASGKIPAAARSFRGFWIFLILMAAEGLTLHHFNLQRHDSMYLFLIPCMYCLFAWLLTRHWPAGPACRDISLIIYMIHPWVIVLVRGAASVIRKEDLLIQQSLIHYLAVAAGSCILAVIIWILLQKIKKKIS